MQHTVCCKVCTFVTIVSYFRLAIEAHAMISQLNGFFVSVLVKATMRDREGLLP